ncbi:MAG: hypothetical protein INR71_02825 [Terriglobus roseus]|nr:hypothetical protein [Terriglobus roseus]
MRLVESAACNAGQRAVGASNKLLATRLPSRRPLRRVARPSPSCSQALCRVALTRPQQVVTSLTTLQGAIGDLLREAAQRSATETAWGAGVLIAFVCNIMNNLPAGLIAGSAVQSAHVPDGVTGAILIGVDIGPNLSVTGSLATILWLNALKREDISVGSGTFLKLGFLVMPPALLLALAGIAVLG